MENADISASESSSATSLGNALSSVLSNPELISKISDIIGGAPSPAPQDVTPPNTPPPGNAPPAGFAAALSNPALMSKLPEVMASLAPLLSATKDGENVAADKSASSAGQEIIKIDAPDKAQRTALLCALKPYLSPRRREVIDYIIRLDRLGDVLRTLT